MKNQMTDETNSTKIEKIYIRPILHSDPEAIHYLHSLAFFEIRKVIPQLRIIKFAN